MKRATKRTKQCLEAAKDLEYVANFYSKLYLTLITISIIGSIITLLYPLFWIGMIVLFLTFLLIHYRNNFEKIDSCKRLAGMYKNYVHKIEDGETDIQKKEFLELNSQRTSLPNKPFKRRKKKK
jgi:dolichol kinase